MSAGGGDQRGEQDAAILIVIAAAAAAGPVAGAAACFLRRLVHREPRIMGWAAVGGLALAAVLHGPLLDAAGRAGEAALRAVASPGVEWESVPARAWPWWAGALLLSPALAWLLDGVLPARVKDLERREQHRERRRLQQTAAATLPRGSDVDGVALGRRLAGDPVLPERKGTVVLPWGWLGRHALVLGSSGSGKTETLLRLAHQTARNPDWSVLFVDGKGDRDTMRRFGALMHHAGRRCRLFPDEPYDGWRGSPADVAARLVEVIDFAQDGPGAYYRDQAVNLIRLACHAPQGPPRSASELQTRLHLPTLAGLYAGHPAAAEVAAYTGRQVDEVRARYSAFFGAVRGRLDGRWAFEDTDTAYLLLDGLRLKHETSRLARFLIEDFTQYAVDRKPTGRRVLLIVDEFSAIAQAGGGLVDVVERTRGFGVAAVLAPQVLEGMGTPEDAARIVGSAHTILLHSIPNPEEIVKVAGTRRVMETSIQHERGMATGLGTARLQHVFRVDPNDVRQLPVGHCYAIRAGQAARLKITQAPAVPDVALPQTRAGEERVAPPVPPALGARLISHDDGLQLP